MANETIINNVDVSECEEFVKNFAIELTNRNLEEREEIGRKYYKQLQREKEKVKELEEKLKQVRNKNLKEVVELIRKNGLEDHIVFQLLDIERKKKDKYKQALEEIKGIAKICISKDICYECPHYYDCEIEDAEIPTYDVCKLILQKCEVLEDEP